MPPICSQPLEQNNFCNYDAGDRVDSPFNYHEKMFDIGSFVSASILRQLGTI